MRCQRQHSTVLHRLPCWFRVPHLRSSCCPMVHQGSAILLLPVLCEVIDAGYGARTQLNAAIIHHDLAGNSVTQRAHSIRCDLTGSQPDTLRHIVTQKTEAAQAANCCMVHARSTKTVESRLSIPGSCFLTALGSWICKTTADDCPA